MSSTCGWEGVSPSANQHSTRRLVLSLCRKCTVDFTLFPDFSRSWMQGGKVLTTGKDIKATQFTLGLTEKQGVKVALGFTKSNELFVGRMAMLGIAASIIGGTLIKNLLSLLWVVLSFQPIVSLILKDSRLSWNCYWLKSIS